jgi:putative PIN family toxin of toxin-antitoxin system
MERSKFDRYASLEARRDFVGFLCATIHIVQIRRSVHICRDPEDDKFLDVAVNGGAVAIVTGDSDLLALGSFEDISIVTPAGYLAEC